MFSKVGGGSSARVHVKLTVYFSFQFNLENCAVVEPEELDDDEIPLDVPSPASGWDPDLSYKVHLQLLETMETLEERVGSASLQVKVSHISNKRRIIV